MKQQYISEYNYFFAMLPRAYRETMTLEKYIKDRTYKAVVRMNSLDLSTALK